jgi:hypothetical protein
VTSANRPTLNLLSGKKSVPRTMIPESVREENFT